MNPKNDSAPPATRAAERKVKPLTNGGGQTSQNAHQWRHGALKLPSLTLSPWVDYPGAPRWVPSLPGLRRSSRSKRSPMEVWRRANMPKRSTMTACSTEITFLDHDDLKWTIQARHKEFIHRRSGSRQDRRTLTNGSTVEDKQAKMFLNGRMEHWNYLPRPWCPGVDYPGAPTWVPSLPGRQAGGLKRSPIAERQAKMLTNGGMEL